MTHTIEKLNTTVYCKQSYKDVNLWIPYSKWSYVGENTVSIVIVPSLSISQKNVWFSKKGEIQRRLDFWDHESQVTLNEVSQGRQRQFMKESRKKAKAFNLRKVSESLSN